MSFKNKGSVTGYRYSLGVHLGLCYGPIDMVYRLEFTDKLGWFGVGTTNGNYAEALDLFGDRDTQGGIRGGFDVFIGWPTQGKSAYLLNHINDLSLPAYRGISAIVLKDFYLANSPMLPTVTPTVQRIFRKAQLSSNGIINFVEQWYPEKAGIPVDEYYFTGTHKTTLISWGTAEYTAAINNFIATPFDANKYALEPVDQSVIVPPYIDTSSGIPVVEVDNPYATDPYNEFPEFDMNPAHIMLELLTSPAYGFNLPLDKINMTSFTYAADLFYTEGLGLSFYLANADPKPVQEFMSEIERHCDAVCSPNPKTGLWEFYPIRNDYVKNSLPTLLYDECRITSLKHMELQNLINSVVVTYTDIGPSGAERSVTVNNVGGVLQSVEQIRRQATVSYPGCTKRSLAMQLATRELLVKGSPLRTLTVSAPRKFSDTMEGRPVRVIMPQRGITDAVFRIVLVSRGSTETDEVVLDLVEDSFDFFGTRLPNVYSPNYTYVDVPLVTAFVPLEMPYYFASRMFPISVITNELSINPSLSYYSPLTLSGGTSRVVRLFKQNYVGDTFELLGTQDFLTGGVTVGNIPKYAWLTTTDIVSWSSSSIIPTVGKLYYLDGEFVRIESIVSSTENIYNLVLARGCLDTVPLSHPAGSILFDVTSSIPYVDSADVAAGVTYIMTAAGSNQSRTIPPGSPYAVSVELTPSERLIRPYPVAKVSLNGTVGFSFVGPLTTYSLVWNSRNRLTQTSALPEAYHEASVAPESGTSYEVAITGYNTSGVAIQENVYLGTTTSLNLSFADTDLAPLDPLVTELRIVITAIRAGYRSYTSPSLSVSL